VGLQVDDVRDRGTNPMKIGMVSKFGEKDGIAIYSDSLVSALRKKGTEVVTIGSKSSEADYMTDLKSFSLRRNLEKIIRKEKLQLLHFQYIAERSYYGLHTLNINLISALKQKVPVAVTLHEVHYKAAGLHERIVKKLEEEVIKRAAAIIVHTKGQKEFIEKAYRTKKAITIHMGVSMHPMHRKKGKNVLFFGMISELKGVEYLIGAMKWLRGYKLSIAGKAVSPKYAEELAIRLKNSGGKSISKPIRMSLGWVPEGKKHEYFESSDILALPYTRNPFQSAVLHDAMSYGLPVVVTRTGPISEIVSEFQCGEVVEPRNGKALADAIKKVHAGYKKYQEGVKRYRKEANWEKAAERHIKAYRKELMS